MNHPDARHMGARRDFSGRHKDGTEFAIEVGLNPIRTGNETIVLCAIIDISERKRLERLQDEFVSTVSHELRTPMTSIAGSLGLLTGGGAGILPAPATRLVTIAYENCQRLVRLVNDILDIKKLESGLMAFNFQRCDACALTEKAIEVNQAIADDYGVRIQARRFTRRFRHSGRSRPLRPGHHQSDFERAQVLAARTKKSSLRSKTGTTACTSPCAIMAPEFRLISSRGFSRNSRRPKSGMRNHQAGTGLGLSIVRQIIMRMHGQIGFDDAPGGGTVFYVDLPRADHLANWQAEFAERGKPCAARAGRGARGGPLRRRSSPARRPKRPTCHLDVAHAAGFPISA